MALSDLIPSITACLENKCGTLTISDDTGVYDVASNISGWDDASTEFTSNIVSATLSITLPGETTATVVDVLSNLQIPATNKFELTQYIVNTPKDGEIRIDYTLVTALETRVVTLCLYSTCLVKCCVDKLWAKYAKGEVEDTTPCGCSTTLRDQTLNAEALLKAIHHIVACNGSKVVRDALLAKLQRICSMEKCNC